MLHSGFLYGLECMQRRMPLGVVSSGRIFGKLSEEKSRGIEFRRNLTGKQGADDHGVFTSENLPVCHVSCQHWAWNRTNVHEGIISPRVICRDVEIRTTCGKISA